MLLDEAQMWYLKIELSAYVEVLEDLRNLCYFLEGDGTDLPFMVGERLNHLAEQYPNGQMKELRSTKKLILEVSSIFVFCVSFYYSNTQASNTNLLLISPLIHRLLIGL